MYSVECSLYLLRHNKLSIHLTALSSATWLGLIPRLPKVMAILTGYDNDRDNKIRVQPLDNIDFVCQGLFPLFITSGLPYGKTWGSPSCWWPGSNDWSTWDPNEATFAIVLRASVCWMVLQINMNCLGLVEDGASFYYDFHLIFALWTTVIQTLRSKTSSRTVINSKA